MWDNQKKDYIPLNTITSSLIGHKIDKNDYKKTDNNENEENNKDEENNKLDV